jgi:hypothetical protein
MLIWKIEVVIILFLKNTAEISRFGNHKSMFSRQVYVS